MVVRTPASSSTTSNRCNSDTSLHPGRALAYLGGQNHRKARAGSRRAGHFDAPAVVRHDLFDDGKAHTGSFLTRGDRASRTVELLKALLQLLLIHADALVAHGNAQPARV